MTTVTKDVAGYRITARYHGGPYIDLCFEGDLAFEVINVWDYATSKSTIPDTTDAVSAALTHWVTAAGDDLSHDLANYRESVLR